MQVLHALEHQSVGFCKWNFPTCFFLAHGCLVSAGDRPWPAASLGTQCHDLSFCDLKSGLQPRRASHRQVFQQVAHGLRSVGDSLLQSSDSRCCQWQGVSIFGTRCYLFIPWKCLLDTRYRTAWDVALSPKRLMWMGFTCSFINSSKPR